MGFAPGGLVRKEHHLAATAHLYMEQIGATLPVRQLDAAAVDGGLLGAAARGSTATFDALAEALERQPYAVVCALGAPSALWPQLCAEGEALWPQMAPGCVQKEDGSRISGKAPSGSRRGDKYVVSSAAISGGSCPTLELLDLALAVVGTHLNAALVKRGLRLFKRSDPFFACFPGDGGRYGAHFDGGGSRGCALTMIAYCSPRWHAGLGGELQLLDEPGRCWRGVLPLADRLVIFRAPHVLHRVAPTYAPRYALSAWWYVAAADGERGVQAALPRAAVVLCRAGTDGNEGRSEPLDVDPELPAQLLGTMEWLCAQQRRAGKGGDGE